MSPVIVVELVKQLFKFGGSFRKEAITVGAFGPALTSVLTTCATSCSDVSTDQWTFLVGSTVALIVHLNAKRVESNG